MRQMIKDNIIETINRLKADKITAMSLDNLFQVTPTPPISHVRFKPRYRAIFKQIAIEVAAALNYELLPNDKG
jgi:hypothetical protein